MATLLNSGILSFSKRAVILPSYCQTCLLLAFAFSTTLHAQQPTAKPFVSTNPKPPAASPPRAPENLGSNLPVDIDQYLWKIKADNEAESSVPTYFINEVGSRTFFGAVPVGTDIDIKYFRRFGPKNYFCVPKPATAGKTVLPAPDNCVWVSGTYVVASGKAPPAPKQP